ncbi:MAG TPA: hypothetical protein VHN77_03795 [Phycisphaerales bacterium]|nr:hypothetical protein [Phycisphaerales bacterium]
MSIVNLTAAGVIFWHASWWSAAVGAFASDIERGNIAVVEAEERSVAYFGDRSAWVIGGTMVIGVVAVFGVTVGAMREVREGPGAEGPNTGN